MGLCLGESRGKDSGKVLASVPEFPECSIHVFFRVVERQTEFLFIQGAEMKRELHLCETRAVRAGLGW